MVLTAFLVALFLIRINREGNKLYIFKIEKIPIFSHDAPKFGFGDGKKCEKLGKKYMEREGKSICFNKLLYIIIIIFCILNKIFRVPWLGYDS